MTRLGGEAVGLRVNPGRSYVVKMRPVPSVTSDSDEAHLMAWSRILMMAGVLMRWRGRKGQEKRWKKGKRDIGGEALVAGKGDGTG